MRRLAAALLLLLSVPGAVGACSCQPQTDAQFLERATAVFVGRAKWSAILSEGPLGQARYSFAVEEVVKGALQARREVEVRSGLDAAACGFPFAVGRKYVVFASALDGKNLATGLCAGTTEHDAAAAEKVRALKRRLRRR